MAYRLVFDTTSSDTQNESANVGAYLRGGNDGGLVHQTSNALHVDIQNASLAVTATDLDIRDLTAASDSVESWTHDGTGNAITSTTGALDVSIANASIVVTATDLDIRNLDFSTDSVTSRLNDGSGNAISSTSGSLDVNLTNASVVVTATDLDIRDLTAASDSVAAWTHDGTGNAITSTTGALDVNIASAAIELDVEDDLADTAVASAQETVAVTTGKLVTADLAARRFLWLYHDGNRDVYLGPSGVTTGNGFKLPPGGLLQMRAGANLAIHAISISGNQSVHVLQAS